MRYSGRLLLTRGVTHQYTQNKVYMYADSEFISENWKKGSVGLLTAKEGVIFSIKGANMTVI